MAGIESALKSMDPTEKKARDKVLADLQKQGLTPSNDEAPREGTQGGRRRRSRRTLRKKRRHRSSRRHMSRK